MIIYWTDASTNKISQVMGKALARTKEPHRFCSSAYPITPAAEPGDIVVALGAQAVDELRAKGIVGKKRTIASMRNVFVEVEGIKYTAMYDPAIVDIDAGKQPEIDWDVQLIARMHRNKSAEVPPHNYQWVGDFQALISRVRAKYEETNKPIIVSFDTETVGLSPFVENPQIVVVQISDRKGYADCWYVSETPYPKKQEVIEQIRWLLNSPMVRQRGANLKYDLVWVKQVWDIDCTNFTMDTLLIGSLLDENRSNSLNMHTKIYAGEALGGYDDAFNLKHDKSRMDLVPKDDMLGYAGGDVDAVLRVSDEMLQELKQWPTLPRFYTKILHPAARTFEKIERTGLLVDRGRYETLRTDLEREITRLEKAGLALMPRRLCAKYSDNLSLGRAALLKDYFFTPMGLNLKPLVRTGKTNEPSTAKSHLEMFGDVPESKAFCEILDELGSAKKTLSTYVVGFLSHLMSDNRFHPGYLLHSGQAFEGESDEGGAVSGRLSARGPAIQTIPKRSKWAKQLRGCFICPPGMAMLSCDYSQGELKLAACSADEEAMIEAYRSGIDLHAKTGAGIAGMELGEFLATKETNPDFYELLRFRSKAYNFGLLYGMGTEGFVRYAWNGYRMKVTTEQAEKDRNAFFNTYPGLLPWHKKYKALARQNSYVISPLGRVRHLPLIRSPDRFYSSKAERQAVNSVIQSTLSDLMLWSLAEIERNYPQIEACAMIHDAGIFYVPEDQVEISAQRVTNVMADLPIEETFGWKPQLRFTADAEAGPDMAHLKKIAVN